MAPGGDAMRTDSRRVVVEDVLKKDGWRKATPGGVISVRDPRHMEFITVYNDALLDNLLTALTPPEPSREELKLLLTWIAGKAGIKTEHNGMIFEALLNDVMTWATPRPAE